MRVVVVVLLIVVNNDRNVCGTVVPEAGLFFVSLFACVVSMENDPWWHPHDSRYKTQLTSGGMRVD